MPRSRRRTGVQLPAGGDPRPRRDKAFSRRRPRPPAAGGACPCPALPAPAAMRRGSPGLRSLPPCRPRRRSGGVGGSGRHGAGSWRRRSPAAEPPSILCAEEQSRPLPTPPPPPHPPRPGGAASPGGGTPAERGRGGAGRRPPPAGAAVAAQPGRRGMAAVASPAAAAAQRTWLLPPFPLCERAATLAHTLSHCSRGRAGGRRGEVGGSGGEEDGGDQRAFSACPSPGGAVEAPAGKPRSLPRLAELCGPGAASPAPGRAAAAEEKSSPELRPRPPERLLCCSAPLALFSRSRLPSAMLQPGGRGASGAPARASLPRAPQRPGGAARPARSPCRPAARPAAAAMATARYRVSGLRRGTARPSPPAAGDPRPLARFLSPASLSPPRSLPPAAPLSRSRPPPPPRPGRGARRPGKGLPGTAPLAFVYGRPSRRCPALRGRAAAAARRPPQAHRPAASGRASGRARPAGPAAPGAYSPVSDRVGTQPSLGPEPQRRSRGRPPGPSAGWVAVQPGAPQWLSAGSIRSLLTLAALKWLHHLYEQQAEDAGFP
ncbi:translation initiation factor IF-2-like [Molothrus ater]|uniref:translation initiation factor IF-2-like n=1 Tax=Molothrus ater TaxID=84834 RepID=UPI0023E767FB|nr:translation initiation factor IF-2-like [Molothrus ater]